MKKKKRKRKRETPQKEWQAKCTRTQTRAHIVKQNNSQTKQNKTDPTRKRAQLYLENMTDGNSYLTPLRPSESQANPEPPTTASNKLKQVGDECQPTLSKLPIPSFLGRYNTERVLLYWGFLYNCTPGLTITFTVMTEFLRKLQQFTLGRCSFVGGRHPM
jgi:hypothetical protein